MVASLPSLISNVALESRVIGTAAKASNADDVSLVAKNALQKKELQNSDKPANTSLNIRGAIIARGLYKGEFLIPNKVPLSLQNSVEGRSAFKELVVGAFIKKSSDQVKAALAKLDGVDSSECKQITLELLSLFKEDPSLMDAGTPCKIINIIEAFGKKKEWLTQEKKQDLVVETKIQLQDSKLPAGKELGAKIENVAVKAGVISFTRKEGKGPFLKALASHDTMQMIKALREGSFSPCELAECLASAVSAKSLDAVCLLTQHIQAKEVTLGVEEKKVIAKALHDEPSTTIALALKEHLPPVEQKQREKAVISIATVEDIASIAAEVISPAEENKKIPTLEARVIEPITQSMPAIATKDKKSVFTRVWNAVLSIFKTDPEKIRQKIIANPAELKNYPKLANDKGFMLSVIKEEPATYLYLGKNLWQDKDFHLELVRANPFVCIYMDKSWLKDSDIEQQVRQGLAQGNFLREKTSKNFRNLRLQARPMDALKHLALTSGIKGKETGEGTPPRSGMFVGSEMAQLLSSKEVDSSHTEVLHSVYREASDPKISSQQRLESYQKGSPILLLTGYLGHSIMVVLHNEHMIICNRGNRDMNQYHAMTYFPIDRDKVTTSVIDNIRLSHSARSVMAMNMIIYEGIPSVLAKESVKDPQALQQKQDIEAALFSKNQTVGNCTYAAWKSSYKACQFLMEIQDKGMDNIALAGKNAKEASDKMSLSLREKAAASVSVSIKKETASLHEKQVLFAAQCKILNKKCKLVKTKKDLADIRTLEDKYKRGFLSGFGAPSLDTVPEYEKYLEKIEACEQKYSDDAQA